MIDSHEQHDIQYTLRKEVNELYASLTIKHFAIALVAIFEPMYLYVFFDYQILPVLIFFGITYLGFVLVLPFGAKIISRIGIKHSIALSIPFIILYYVGLRAIGDFSWVIYVIPVVSILYKMLYWPAFHLDFARFSEHKHRGRQVSILKMIKLGSSIVGPFLGGLIILEYGYQTLFLFAVILLLASSIPLFLSKEVYEPVHFSFKDFFRFIASPKIRRAEIGILSWGFDEIMSLVIWPIFMFIVIADYSVIGGIASAVTVIAFVFAYWIGKLSDRVGHRHLLRFGAIFTSISWVLRSMTTNAIQIAGANSVYKLSGEAAFIGFNSIIYDKANENKSQRLTLIIFREFVLNLGKVAGIIAAGVIIGATGSLPITFIAAAIATLFLFFL